MSKCFNADQTPIKLEIFFSFPVSLLQKIFGTFISDDRIQIKIMVMFSFTIRITITETIFCKNLLVAILFLKLLVLLLILEIIVGVQIITGLTVLKLLLLLLLFLLLNLLLILYHIWLVLGLNFMEIFYRRYLFDRRFGFL